MAFLGVASLIGVIVSHIIVLFDFIEEKHAEGAPLEDALLDAGIVRLRPVLVTVGATVFACSRWRCTGAALGAALLRADRRPDARHGRHALVLVPVLYAIFVLDLKIVKWEEVAQE